jgi:hypothetical protein
MLLDILSSPPHGGADSNATNVTDAIAIALIRPLTVARIEENLVPRVAADRAPIAERGAFGIRPEPAAAIARRRGGQTRRAPGRGRKWRVV